MITNPKDYKKMAALGNHKLFKWMLRVLRDVEPLSQGGIAKAANDLIERCINGEEISDHELQLIARQTYYGKPGGWANYATSTTSQILVDLRYPNTMRNNDNKRVPFKTRSEGAYTLTKWDHYIAYQFTYALAWASRAGIDPDGERNPKKVEEERIKLYLSWLNSM